MVEHVITHKRATEVLKDYGSTLLGWPRYRLVWAPSRFRYLVGEFRPLYRNSHEWILEEWRPAKDYGTPEYWDAQKTDQGESRLGPYPYNGDYEEMYRMGDLNPSEHQLQFMAKVVRQAANETDSQKAARWRADEDRKVKEIERVIGDIIHDSKPTQRELADYYTNDFRFEKQMKQRPQIVQGEQVLQERLIHG
jgi:hypothetical protein